MCQKSYFFNILWAHLYFISQITDISFSLETFLAKITQILFAPLENYTSGSTIIIGEAKTNHKIAFIAYFSHDALLIVCVRKWPCRCGNTVKSRIIKCLMALKSGKMWYEWEMLHRYQDSLGSKNFTLPVCQFLDTNNSWLSTRG